LSTPAVASAEAGDPLLVRYDSAMKPSAAAPALAAALALAALLAPGAPLRAQTAPPWRPLIVVDPRAVLRAQHQHAAPKRKPTPRPRAHPSAAPGAEIFERYDTAPSPRPR
jgi:hypothetical protein